MKVLTIIGARPQFIKAAPVSAEILRRKNIITEVIVHTGQHFEDNMSKVFFDQLGINKPDHNLRIHSLSHGAMTGKMMEVIEKVLQQETPDVVLVYGDTNSTLAGALTASKCNIPVAHVEAGLRSFDMNMPEEINRIVTDRISKILFCPTKTAIKNLKVEGFLNFPCKIINTGDVMLDAALYFENKAVAPDIKIQNNFILATIHRQSNTNDLNNLKQIVDALSAIAEKHPIVLPLHPRTDNIMKKNNLKFNNASIKVIKPTGYTETLWLLKNTSLVMTDSGGLQKEAFFFGKPCVTLRHETEWTELADTGFNILTGANKDNIIAAVNKLYGKEFSPDTSFFGEGKASIKIVNALIELIN